MKMPSTTCQNFTTATAEDEINGQSRRWGQAGNARTEILFKDGGTLEIYHIRRQATETKVGRGEKSG
jgi:hypothetical protein